MFGNNAFDKKIIKLIDQDERHNNETVISALDLLKMLKNRFTLMQDILKPLVNILSEEIMITNIYFTVELDGSFSINIDYIKNKQHDTIVLCQFADSELEIVNLHKDRINDIIMDNKKRIIDIFNHGLDESFDRVSEMLNSTSNLLLLLINNNYLLINNANSRGVLDQFKLSFNLSGNQLIDYGISTSYKNIEAKLNEKDDNIDNLLEHIKVYKKNIPFYLNKKM